jgi:hypothetical protein
VVVDRKRYLLKRFPELLPPDVPKSAMEFNKSPAPFTVEDELLLLLQTRLPGQIYRQGELCLPGDYLPTDCFQ